jgi:uncharacterized protein YbjT (DUF2867 family)
MPKQVFITGGTGYMGRRLISRLIPAGYTVKALVRKGSERKLPPGCTAIIGNPFDADSFSHHIEQGSTFIQLLGVSHPGPSKKDLFYKIDYASAAASVAAATQAGCSHFVYVSVAQTPTSVMHDYQVCRAKCEKLIQETTLKASIIRPWYVIGPGHYWPLFFFPLFKLLEIIPGTSEKAKSLRLVYLRQMLDTLVRAVDHPPEQTKFFEIQEIRMPLSKSPFRLNQGY